jgi:hypothetical protein
MTMFENNDLDNLETNTLETSFDSFCYESYLYIHTCKEHQPIGANMKTHDHSRASADRVFCIVQSAYCRVLWLGILETITFQDPN